MAVNILGELLEKRRSALVEYCIGGADGRTDRDYTFLKTPSDLAELLRLDPLDNYQVQSSWVAEAISSAQQYIHAVYRKMEPGFVKTEFDKQDLADWALYSNYPDWAALQMIAVYPENFINPFVRQRKSSLFKNLENSLNQTRLNADSVQLAMRDYLQTFEQTCNLDVISAYMDGESPTKADYYFVGRQREQPFQYFWRKAQVELSPTCTGINPAAWSEWQAVDIAAEARIVDMRPLFWNGRLCLIWAEWRDSVGEKTEPQYIPHKLTINLAFMTQNGQWLAPLRLFEKNYEKDHSQGARLIATLWADQLNPKGKLGIQFINQTSTDLQLKIDIFRDVLFRPVEDDGEWLDEMVKARFTTPDIVQHPVLSQVTITSVHGATGRLVPFLRLRAMAFRLGAKDVLMVQGVLLPSTLEGTASVTLTLENPAGGDPEPSTKTMTLRLGGATGWLRLERNSGAVGNPVFTFGSAAEGLNTFTLAAVNLAPWAPSALLKNTADAAQFLHFKQDENALEYVRLNSLFGPELVQRASISVDAILDWETQFLPEPGPNAKTDFEEPNGAFDGANGLFFWELFFHVPHLIATRLRAEDRFQEAQDWLHYLFDPQGPADPTSVAELQTGNPRPPYWRCRPLTSDGNSGCEAWAPTDPDAIGYAAPRHLKILVFSEYVNNLMAWGDWYYRQLTRDSLVAAKLCYIQAEFFMGKAPSARTVNQWETKTVEQLLALGGSRSSLEQFEKALDFNLAQFPVAADRAPLMGLLAVEPFKLPLNQQLLDLFALPAQRLHNLRNNLTLDGRPLLLPLFSPPTDPNQLLRDLAAGNVGSPRPMGGRLEVGAFRWRVTYEAALRAVQTLQDYGNQVLRLLEQRDRAEQEELQQNHLVELGAYAQTVQEQVIAQLQASVAALEQSKVMAQERAEAYARVYDENVSAVEYQVMESIQLSKILAVTSSGFQTAGAVLASLPNIFGLANGGHRLEEGLQAVGFALGISAQGVQLDADKQATTEAYRRRRNEWNLQRNQALAEIRALDEQITAQGHAVASARAGLEQTLRANAQALTFYNFLKKRACNTELLGWLLGQLKTLHYQAYDAVVSLCISAQASLSAETADYDAQIPLPQIWLDSRHGLTAGEHLREYLLRMEREYLQRFERRLELVKTVSLRRLFEDTTDPQTGAQNWPQALSRLLASGTLEFNLSQLLFDRDHPGHYCRQINSVEVDLPVLTGPYEDVRATLLQVGSMTATKATRQSIEYLYAPAGAVGPADVQINLRSSQQIALSSGFGDNGMTILKPDEGLLNPFECTGAVSRWILNFPWPGKDPQKTMLASLTDIIVRIRYTAKVGDATFLRVAQDMVGQVETREPRKLRGSEHHG
ncbi:neuraminidase-like domain-containing protein [Pseudomonas sp. PB106]|uniref:Tc toxin subunit A-related protein n=1 Tax=Pseudomonas sp. PB106 TaxID=2494699 RepID=UPI00131C6788|nr:neuraminidase-like domain-containing protein [Pseudomonas sp. PB106]KAE9639223.1 insecticidal toxin complex protein TcaB2 [Pseudomonas sp. PB106]